jgi:hypothetical protein
MAVTPRRSWKSAFALGSEQHPRLIDIDKQRDVVVATSGGGLVDGDLGDVGGVDPRSPLSDIVVNHAPQA